MCLLGKGDTFKRVLLALGDSAKLPDTMMTTSLIEN